MQVQEAGGKFVMVEKDIPKPAANEVLIKVEACGICHSDAFVKEGHFPGIAYPRTPGHEVIGRIEACGSEVHHLQQGQRVGVGWHGGHCFVCDSCRRGDFISCQNAKICGISYDGGYAEYLTAPHEAIALVPDDLDSAEAAPLLCAGITVYNALRNAGAQAGDVVAVQGIGGLGHLAVQYAVKMGFRTVAISSSDSKKDLAASLGAHQYINASAESAAEALQKLGGAKIIITTAPNAQAMTSVVDGLSRNGKLLMVAATPEPMQVSSFQLLMGRKSIAGWPSGTAIDSEDTLNFSVLSDVKPQIEKYPLEKANEAYEKMITNKARFRVVLTMA